MQKIAVILPQHSLGGTLRAAKDMAKMIQLGFAQSSRPVQVIFAYLPGCIDPTVDLRDLREARITSREITFHQPLGIQEAEAALRVAGRERPLEHAAYTVPVDGASGLLDCDFWLFISDRLAWPVLPLRPYGVLNFHCIQRYVPEIFNKSLRETQRHGFIPFVRGADVVLATTPSTAQDLNSFYGVRWSKIQLIPMTFDHIACRTHLPPPMEHPYFVWTSGDEPHRNHIRVLKALEMYYEQCGGTLKVLMTGIGTEFFRPDAPDMDDVTVPYVRRVRDTIAHSKCLCRNLVIAGHESHSEYANVLRHARFLLHPNLNDNGPFSVIDAAYLSTPAVSSRYPAMEFMNECFRLNLSFFDPYSSLDILRAIREMEARKDPVVLPSPEFLDSFHWRRHARVICDVLSPYLQESKVHA